MKKRIIALSVAAALGGIAGSANAQAPASTLTFNPRGVGHILYIPYFSTQEGNVTAISIVNTDTYNGKVLKVRFRGASNSDDVYDFQVFLSPADVWTAGISQGADGRARLDTEDKSCTLPANVNGPFITSRLPAAGGVNETREGYVEILNMADIPYIPEQFRDEPELENYWDLWDAVKHVNGVAPCTSTVLAGLTYETGQDFLDSGLSYPTTGLMASWSIINVQKIFAYAGDAAAIEARDSGGFPGYGQVVYWDQRPTALTAAQANANTADPLLRGASPVVAGARYDLPDLSTPYAPASPNPNCPFCQARLLSDAINTTQIAGEFFNLASLGGATDYVVSFPTRRYFAAVRYTGTGAPAVVRTAVTNGNIYFTADNTELGNASNGGKAYQLCSKLGVGSVAFFDREETPSEEDDIVISPGTPTQLSICGEVSVVGINAGASTATGGSVARSNVTNGFTEGWLSLTVPLNSVTVGTDTYSGYWGLPMLGRQFTRINNTITNVYYGVSFPARITETGEKGPYAVAGIP